MNILLNDGWEFSLDGGTFEPVGLPHDWLITDTDDLYKSGTGVYRRELDISDVREGQRVFLRFDGVYMESELYVNGTLAGCHKYGYTAFEHELTPFLREAGNLLELRVTHTAPNSRWYSGAGIYRDVRLVVKNACHFKNDGIYVSTYRENGDWRFKADTEVETNGKPYEVRHTLEGEPQTWDIDHPHLCMLRSELVVDGEVTDVEHTRFGFREIRLDPNDGFFLNGRHVKLNGVCLHHDLGALGAAMHKEALRRRFVRMRKMGVNALRTAHNPPSRVFMELADEMGFLVMSELTDVWHRSKTTNDYSQYFNDCVEGDAASWIRRDRNCPSVIMWSLGNEILDTHVDAERGMETMRRLMRLVELHDPERHAFATLCSNYMAGKNTQACADVIKLIGYNYAERLYEEHHAAHTDWIIYGSETGSTLQSRGIYKFPLSASILTDDDHQCSSLGNCMATWVSKDVEDFLLADRNASFSLGQFIWAGQDYIGEPTPYNTRSSYFGHVDTAGFPKDSYYIIKAAWAADPMVHILPYWDFSPGQLIDVRVCTNAARVELFLNGDSLGVKTLNGRLIADWQVPYRHGDLRAVAYSEDGGVAAETVRKSFGDTAELSVCSQQYGDLHFYEFTAKDSNSNTVENACDRVRITVENGSLVGMDNGNPADGDGYVTDTKRLFGGRLLAIVRQDGDTPPRVTATLDNSDIRARKIELVRDGMTVHARLYPAGAVSDGLYWRLCGAGGADSPLGVLNVADDRLSATILPQGDGAAYIHCGIVESSGRHVLISQLDLTISGVGKPRFDPYAFVSASLCSRASAELRSAGDYGVVTPLDGTRITFDSVDFGDIGSDELTVPMYEKIGVPFTFELYEGDELLCTATFDIHGGWEVYQDLKGSLPRRLQGVTSLTFAFNNSISMKGFVFKRLQR